MHAHFRAVSPLLAHTALTTCLAAGAAAGPAAAQVTFPDLIHRWSAEGTADDSVGGAHGALHGAISYVPGRFGQAFDFDSGEFITCGAATCNFGTSDFTMSFWARFDAPALAPLVTKRGVCALAEMIDVRSNVMGGVKFEIAGDGPANYTSFVAPGSVVDGNWRHLAWRRTGLTSVVFIDGCVAAVKVHDGLADFSNAAEFTLGRSPCVTSSDGTVPFVGQMDEIQIYLRGLDDAEIVMLAEGAASGPDLDGSGAVDGADLGLLLGAWGSCPAAGCCLGDLDGSGAVDGADLGLLLGAWG